MSSLLVSVDRLVSAGRFAFARLVRAVILARAVAPVAPAALVREARRPLALAVPEAAFLSDESPCPLVDAAPLADRLAVRRRPDNPPASLSEAPLRRDVRVLALLAVPDPVAADPLALAARPVAAFLVLLEPVDPLLVATARPPARCRLCDAGGVPLRVMYPQVVPS